MILASPVEDQNKWSKCFWKTKRIFLIELTDMTADVVNFIRGKEIINEKVIQDIRHSETIFFNFGIENQ